MENLQILEVVPFSIFENLKASLPLLFLVGVGFFYGLDPFLFVIIIDWVCSTQRNTTI